MPHFLSGMEASYIKKYFLLESPTFRQGASLNLSDSPAETLTT
jgi:hypothetical protein